jgi:branched-chain amino acid transport system substrate-binding protein
MYEFTRKRRTRVLAGLALTAVSALVLAGCSTGGSSDKPSASSGSESTSTSTQGSGTTGDLTFKMGALLPKTGSLAFLGPPMSGGTTLAVKEVNDAAAGITIDLTEGDEGDTDSKLYDASMTTLRNAGITGLVGAASSAVTKIILPENVAANIVEVSPSNTSPDFTTIDDNGLYFRTAPSDLLQGEVLAGVMADDQKKNLAIIYQNDAYGTGLNEAIASNFEASGGKVVAQESFNVGDAQFDSQVSAVAAAKPDAIAVVSYDQFKTIGPLLVNAGFTAKDFYLVDGNLKQYAAGSADEISIDMTGAKGTKAGPKLPDDFTERLQANWTAAGNPKVEDWTYAAEAYDAVVLMALAALAAKSTDGKDVAAKMQEVSGGSGDGTECTSFADCAKIINDGGVANYNGYSGDVDFDEAGDPQAAAIGVYEYKAANQYERID